MPSVCIVVPCFNEALRIDLGSFSAFVSERPDIDLIFVNDGSSDSTGELLGTFASERAHRSKVLNLSENRGKAEAVRQGMIMAFDSGRYDFVAFWDADLAAPLNEIAALETSAVTGNKRIAMASRMKRLGAEVERKAHRHVLGRIFSTFTSIILKLPVYDTQCGAKLFSSSVKPIFEQPFISRWLFDVELLARYHNTYGLKAALEGVFEVPVGKWKEKGGSKLGIMHMMKAPAELFMIWLKYNKGINETKRR